MRGRSRLSALLILGCTALGPSSPAHADDAAGARAAYGAGSAALRAGSYREAALRFEEAARLRPHGAARFAAGKAWELAGEPARAADDFAAALDLGSLDPGDKAEAKRRLLDLETHLGTVLLSGDGTMTATFDDHASIRPPAALHVLPGDRAIAVSAGDRSGRKPLTLAAGQRLPFELGPSLLDAPPPAAGSGPAADSTSANGGLRLAGFAGIGGAVVSAGVAIGLGVAALGSKRTFQAAPTRANFNHAEGLQTGTNVAWAVAAVLGAAGATLLVVSFTKAPLPAQGASAHLSIGAGSASIRGEF
jgi:hypothetical protein